MMSNGGGWWLLGVPLMLVCMLMMARIMTHGHGGASHTDSTPRNGHSDARRILGDRLARGEIDVDEYGRRLTALEDRSDHDRT